MLVGIGTCAFTLVSAYGFSGVLDSDVQLDPSRIAAQIVSGIGFLGAGVIFKGRNMVRGLTTAATIWVAAAVGMACGAGNARAGDDAHGTPPPHAPSSSPRSSAGSPTVITGSSCASSTVTAVGSSERSSPSRARWIQEHDPRLQRFEDEDGVTMVRIDVRFDGKRPLHMLIPMIMELDGVDKVSMREDRVHSVDSDGDPF
ncbi:MgtC/SapB family protein [Brevibacterium casei]|uniref:MgtC/SapB family protein n=1 Tax=Brevibacterium casei TaxID=33889 RepID=UPI001CBA67DA|nr:MgtC/SapB family protein [Brevibacterium casei]